jgi:cell division protein ZapA
VRARDRIAVLAALNLAFDLADKAEPAASELKATSPIANGTASQDSEVLHNLLGRLDDALSEDGQLL